VPITAEKTGSAALTTCAKVTFPALSAITEVACAAAEQKATGSIATRSESLSLGKSCLVGAAKPTSGRKLYPMIQIRNEYTVPTPSCIVATVTPIPALAPPVARSAVLFWML
jgi:hypothetical protein